MDQLVITERSKTLVHTIIGIKTGWRHEVEGKRGITHFLEHAIFLGNNNHPSPDIETEKYGVQLNGMTNPEHTLFWFTSTREDFQDVFKLCLSLIFHPDFNENKIEKEKQTKILPAVVHETDFTPWELANEWAMNLIFDWDFLLSLGKEEDINSLTKEDLGIWHKKYYGSLNSFIVTNGRIQKNEVVRLVEEADVPFAVDTPFPSGRRWNRKEVFVGRKGMKNMELVYGFRLPHYDIGYEILSIILGRHPLGKLWGDKFSKFAYAMSSRVEWTSTGGGLFVNFGTNSCNSASEIDKNLWVLLRDFDIDEGELEAAKRVKLLKMLRVKEEGEQPLLNFVTHPSFYTHKSFEKMLQEVNQVEKTRILTFASHFLNKENAVRVTVGPEK